jgi:hypothetical protein
MARKTDLAIGYADMRGGEYTISPDGHFVGHDRFVVPRDFFEFFEQYPRYVKGFVRWRVRDPADQQDREHDLLLYLLSLPEKSKYRAVGYTDRVQIFDPARSGGANAARFFGWIRFILARLENKLSARERRYRDRVGGSIFDAPGEH